MTLVRVSFVLAFGLGVAEGIWYSRMKNSKRTRLQDPHNNQTKQIEPSKGDTDKSLQMDYKFSCHQQVWPNVL